MIVIEGTGEWVSSKYRPAIQSINKGRVKPAITVIYANDETWSRRPIWVKHLDVWERYLNKSDPIQRDELYDINQIDAVFVVTPDRTHATIAAAWMHKVPIIFVEKPFETDVLKIQALMLEMARHEAETGHRTAVVGIDHYLLRLAPVIANTTTLQSVLDALGGYAETVCFEITESNLIEAVRERTLALGLGLDLLPHFAAVLLCLGPVETIDLVRVVDAVQYSPLDGVNLDSEKGTKRLTVFNAETGLRGFCRFEDFLGEHINAGFCAGKGIHTKPRKRLSLYGTSGQSVTFDFDTDKVYSTTVPELASIDNSNEAYKKLLLDLCGHGTDTLCACLSISDSEQIVRYLDAMWRATQWIRNNGGLRLVHQGDQICQCETGGVKANEFVAS